MGRMLSQVHKAVSTGLDTHAVWSSWMCGTDASKRLWSWLSHRNYRWGCAHVYRSHPDTLKASCSAGHDQDTTLTHMHALVSNGSPEIHSDTRMTGKQFHQLCLSYSPLNGSRQTSY